MRIYKLITSGAQTGGPKIPDDSHISGPVGRGDARTCHFIAFSRGWVV